MRWRIIANSLARLTGQPAEQLSAGNCANPRFSGSVGDGGAAPVDPLAGVTSIGAGGGPAGSTTADGATAGDGTGTAAKAGSTKSSGGGSTDWRQAVPVAYTGSSIPTSSTVALLALLAIMVVPIGAGILRSRRRND